MVKKQFRAVELNKLDQKTIHTIRIWRNQPFVREKMYTQNMITEEEHQKYIEKVKKDPNRGIYVFYLDNEPFGVYQYEIHLEGNYVTNGNYLISEEYQCMGYGVIQIYFINEIIFKILKCHKSYGEVIDYNKNVIMINKKMGANLDGILRQHILQGGIYHDIYCYSMFEEEWEENKKKIEKKLFRIILEEYEIIN